MNEIKNGNKVRPKEFKQKVLIHGHCHQKSQNRVKGLTGLLNELQISNHLIDSSCCGMAGSFGYDAKHYDISKKMAHLSLIPAIKKSEDNEYE